MLVVVFDRPASPGNLGTIIRSCDALSVDGLVITGHAADLYDPETISATTGSFFAMPTVRLPSQRELEAWLATIRQTIGPLQVVGSSAKAEVDIAAHDFTQPTAAGDRQRDLGAQRGLQGALRPAGDDPDRRLGHIAKRGQRGLDYALRDRPAAQE